MRDGQLLSWGSRTPSRLPRLWLFSDLRRLPDPVAAARHLPVGRAGIVFRHDDAAQRRDIGRQLAAICRQRRLHLVVAGDARLAAALQAGQHLRAGCLSAPLRLRRPATTSAHSIPDLIRARRLRADLVFLSPVFPTDSHPGAVSLGPLRWNHMVRYAGLSHSAAALGGISGGTVRRLGRACKAIGAIGALTAGKGV